MSICTCGTESEESCNCPVLLDSKCVFYQGDDDLTTIPVTIGDDLETILIAINNYLLNQSTNLYTNIGTGEGLFKQVNLLSQAEFKSVISSNGSILVTSTSEEVDLASLPIVSDTLDVTYSATEITLEVPSFDNLQRYIVNNLYTGAEELGTLSKPFKTIQAAIDAFVGTGTADNPEFDFATIVIQKGSTYTFTGNFSYRNLNVVVEEDAEITHTPTTGAYFVDYDSLTDIKSDLNIEVKQGAVVTLSEKGFRNIGSTGGSAQAKTIRLSGNGTIDLIGARQSGYALLEANYSNSAGYAMPSRQNIIISDLSLMSDKKDFWNVGRDASIIITDCVIRHSDEGEVIDLGSESFDQLGGDITLNNCDLFILGVERTSGFTLYKDPSYSCNLTLNSCKLTFPGDITNFFVNKSNPDMPTINCRFFSTTNSNTITDIFDSPVLWTTVNFEFNSFFSGDIDTLKVDLTRGDTLSTTNIVKGQVIDSLVTFPDRVTASASLSVGAKFINTNGGDLTTANHFIDIVIP